MILNNIRKATNLGELFSQDACSSAIAKAGEIMGDCEGITAEAQFLVGCMLIAPVMHGSSSKSDIIAKLALMKRAVEVLMKDFDDWQKDGISEMTVDASTLQ